MAGKYSLKPVEVKKIETKNRKIVTKLPVPESIPVLESLFKYEPVSMQGQPPIVWEKAEGFNVYDAYGNKWIDWSSGVLITNAGHAHEGLVSALKEIADSKLLTTYCFPHKGRAELVKKLVEKAPAGLTKVFLLSTGSEATENTIKLARTWGRRSRPEKKIIVSFVNSFHGRTLGAQLAGGIPRLKEWIGMNDDSFVQVPFPDGYRNEDVSFDLFESSLKKLGVNPDNVAGVISETYQGVGPNFMPVDYAQKLRKWCDKHGALLIFDEIQAGFGRTGKYWGFENYGIAPDLIACGKGISGAMPLSAVIGREDVMSIYPPGAMTSTHSGNPVCCACAIASMDIIDEEKLVENSSRMGKLLYENCVKIQKAHPKVLGHVCGGYGLVAGILVVKPGTKDPDSELALKINERCFQKGLLMFAPVGTGGECIKIAPPLSISEDALMEGIEVLAEVCKELCS